MSYAIYDFNGNVSDDVWLHSTFGEVVVADDERKQYSVNALRARTGDASIVVRVIDEAGNAIPGVKVVFSWPDAPVDESLGWHSRGVVGETNEEGCVGFGMGPGAYYWPPAGGPHSVWIYGVGTSQAVGGLGMIGATNHDHVNVEFIRGAIDPPKRYRVDVAISGNGTVIENPEQPSNGYVEGTIVGLEAVPSSEWKFSGWLGDVDSMDNPLYVTPDRDIYVLAVFEYSDDPTPPPVDWEEEIVAISENVQGIIDGLGDVTNNLSNIKAILDSLVSGG